MLMQEGVVLGHFISAARILVDLAKIKVIPTLPIPTKPKDVRSFLGHASYYRNFIKYFSKITSPLYTLLKMNSIGHPHFMKPSYSLRNSSL